MRQQAMKPFEQVEHTADYALVVRGRDLRELIENAGGGMISLLVDAEAVAATQKVEFTAEADSPERLLLQCLRELLYLEEDEGLVPVEFTVTGLCEDSLEAKCTAAVAPIDQARPHLLVGIKAVTYHDLHIVATPRGLEVQIVFDV